jgi:hypothetical protein
MKKLVYVLALVLAVIACSQEKKSPIVGTWQGVAETTDGWTGSHIKMWTENYCAYLGEYRKDTMVFTFYGGGPYTLEGTHSVETIVYNTDKNTIGKTANMIIEIHGDTLIQKYPADENWQIDSATCNTDIYVRIK